MSKEPERFFSDERLNAFVDGELAATEREEVLAASATDPEVARRLCALRAGKELLRHAYDPASLPVAARRRGRSGWWSSALAASVLLTVGVLTGMQVQRAATHQALAPLEWASHFFVAQPGRILVHLDHADPEHMEATLDLVEAYVQANDRAQVEVVVNNHGLDLLRVDRTPFAARIAALELGHPNVLFIACDRAIARFEQAGEQVAILPQAVRTRNAIAHIAGRMQGGWTYVKV